MKAHAAGLLNIDGAGRAAAAGRTLGEARLHARIGVQIAVGHGQRFLAPAQRVGEVVDLLGPVVQGRLCRSDHVFELGKALADRVLEHGRRIAALVELQLQRRNLVAQLADAHLQPADIDKLVGGFIANLAQRGLQAADGDGIRCAQEVFVGLDVGQRHRHGRFQPFRRQAHCALP